MRLAELTGSICKAIRFAFKMTRRNTCKDIPWDGPDIIPSMENILPNLQDRLTLEGLRLTREGCASDTLDVLITIAVQIGIEQGRRIEATEREKEGR